MSKAPQADDQLTTSQLRQEVIDQMNRDLAPHRFDWDTVEGDDGQGWITLAENAPSRPTTPMILDDPDND